MPEPPAPESTPQEPADFVFKTGNEKVADQLNQALDANPQLRLDAVQSIQLLPSIIEGVVMNPAVQKYLSRANFPSEQMTLTVTNDKVILTGKGKIYPAEEQLKELPFYLRPLKGKLENDGIEIQATTELITLGDPSRNTDYMVPRSSDYVGIGPLDKQIVNFVKSKYGSLNKGFPYEIGGNNVNWVVVAALHNRGVNLTGSNVGVKDGQFSITLLS